MTWVRVASSDRIPEGRGIVANLGPISVAVFRHQGRLFALDNDCPHQHGPLGMGWIEGDCVVCPLHHWKFHVETGRMPLLQNVGVRTHAVEERPDGVYVDLPADVAPPEVRDAGR